MKKSEQKDIDGDVYEFFPMPPKVALRVLTRLSKLVLEPLGMFGDAIKGDQGGNSGAEKSDGERAVGMLDKKSPPDVFAKAAKVLVERLDEDEVTSTIETVLSATTVHVQRVSEGDKGTRPLRFDLDFAGRPGHLLKVFVAGLEVQFGDFFGASGGGLGALVARARQGMK